MIVKILVDNNEAIDEECKCSPAPGLSLLLDRGEFSILFDTGPDNTILSNADRLEIDREKIKKLVISHKHRDHTGGLDAVFSQRPDLEVYLPEDIPTPFASAEVIDSHVKLMDVPGGELRIYHMMGEYKGFPIPENALVLVDSDGDAYLFCGCCHIGIVNLVEEVSKRFSPVMISGGLHLIGKPREEIDKIAEKLVEYGIEVAMPIHCSGYAIREALSEKGVAVIEAGVCSQVPIEYRS